MLLSVGEPHRLDRLMRDGLLVLLPHLHLDILHLCISLVCTLISLILFRSGLVNSLYFFYKFDPIRRRGAVRGA